MLPYLEKKARKNGFAIFTYTEDRMIADQADNEHILQEAFLNRMELIEEPEFSVAVDFAPSKCMLVSDDEEALIGLEEHWKKRLNGALDVFRSEPYFLEVLPCGIDKSTSLGALLSHLDITPEEIIVIGDGVCDVSMIQFAGLGIAMGNAQDSVKVCADVVTASNEEDGKSGHSIYLCFRRPGRGYYAGRRADPSAFRHSARRCHVGTGRDCCRTGFDDSLPARRDCGWYAGQR